MKYPANPQGKQPWTFFKVGSKLQATFVYDDTNYVYFYENKRHASSGTPPAPSSLETFQEGETIFGIVYENNSSSDYILLERTDGSIAMIRRQMVHIEEMDESVLI